MRYSYIGITEVFNVNKLLTFSFIGGDRRQLSVVSALASDGFHIRIFGFDDEQLEFPENIHISKSVTECVSGADVIVFPLPYSQAEGQFLNAPLSNMKIKADEVIFAADKDAVLFAGKVDVALDEFCRNANIKVIDYAKREELLIMNAIPTAEGAIEIAMAKTPFTIKDSKCLVIGYGRIGKILSADLKGLGAAVTATARKHSDLAWIEANGCCAAATQQVPEIAGQFDIIFNTVPYKILDFKALSKTKSDVLIIDLASRPGGVDFEVARELSRETVWALSLPGKAAPDTAGEIIKNTLINILEELGV